MVKIERATTSGSTCIPSRHRAAASVAALTLALSLTLPCGVAWGAGDEAELTGGFSAVTLADGVDGRDPSEAPVMDFSGGGTSNYGETEKSSGETELQTDSDPSQEKEQKGNDDTSKKGSDDTSKKTSTSSGTSSGTTSSRGSTSTTGSSSLAKTSDDTPVRTMAILAGCGFVIVVIAIILRLRRRK